MKFSELIGKTIINTQLMKKNGYDDEAWVRLDFTDGTHCFVVSSYGSYSGDSEDEYPAFIFLRNEVEGLLPIEEAKQQVQADSRKKEENMANWGIASTAPEIEKVKAEMADYLHGLNSCAEIDYSIYSQLFDFSLPLIQKAYELGKKEAQ